MKGRMIVIIIVLNLTIFASGCVAFVAGAAAGGAGAYIMRDQGYKLQSPVTK